MKLKPGVIGVYMIRNMVNGKVYIGSASVCMRRRWWQHKTTLRMGKHKNPHLQAAWNKYGREAFEFSILVYCTPEECIKSEQAGIDAFDATNRELGYNQYPVAGSPTGHVVSPETRVKLAEKARNPSPETRARMSASQKAYNASLTEEERAKRFSMNVGRQWSPEAIAKRGAANKGRKLSPEHRAKLLTANLGKKRSAATIAKMSAAAKNMSAEQRAKIAATLRRHWEAKRAAQQAEAGEN